LNYKERQGGHGFQNDESKYLSLVAELKEMSRSIGRAVSR